jgi:FemAB-related protein (PEP-CTERM system-associated)
MGQSDEADWDAFVMRHPDATFFHLSPWKHILEREFGARTHYLIARQSTQVTGILPLAQVKNLIAGNVLASIPYFVRGGVVAKDQSTRDALIQAAVELGERLHVGYLELREPTQPSAEWVAESRHAGFRKQLSARVEDNLQAIPRKQRAMVRKGLKSGLDVSWAMDLDAFYRVFSESYRNLGTPVFGQSLFERVVASFPDSVWLTTLARRGQPVSSVLSFRFKNEVLPYYGGGGVSARTHAANDLMYWLVMERAAQEGVDWFDFGRSKVDSGSYRFKKHWGFEPEPMPYQFRLIRDKALPNLTPTNPKFQLPIAIWKRLPIGISRLLGPAIARRIV